MVAVGGRRRVGGVHMGSGGKAGDGKGAAVAIVVAAAVALVAVAAVEGSRFDGYANLHPMHPVYLVGKDGQRVVMPLAWIDPQTASWAKEGYVRRSEGPWQELERAPLDRARLELLALRWRRHVPIGRRSQGQRHRDDDPARLLPGA